MTAALSSFAKRKRSEILPCWNLLMVLKTSSFAIRQLTEYEHIVTLENKRLFKKRDLAKQQSICSGILVLDDEIKVLNCIRYTILCKLIFCSGTQEPVIKMQISLHNIKITGL